jgi:RimJ/RimL family protein N-acetyltransferase
MACLGFSTVCLSSRAQSHIATVIDGRGKDMPPQCSEKLFQWPLRKLIMQGYSVRLTPVDYSHLDQLSRWSAEEDIWRYMTFAHLASRDELQSWIGSAMDANERGTELNFAIIDETSQSAVGTTSFYRIVPGHKRLELGKTWLGAPYRRTHINTAAKYLMLNHAFETIRANRVELNTDARNVRSQQAMERLGAVRDGVLRCHTIMRDGFVRDTVTYSFTLDNWPATKILLTELLERRDPRPQSKSPSGSCC